MSKVVMVLGVSVSTRPSIRVVLAGGVLGESRCIGSGTWRSAVTVGLGVNNNRGTMQEAGSERDLQRQWRKLGTAVSRGMGRLEAATSRRKTGDAAAGTERRGSDGQGRRRGAEGRRGTRRRGRLAGAPASGAEARRA